MAPKNTLLKTYLPPIIVILGVSGDLAKRKVLPALYHLLKDGLLPPKTLIIGTSRNDIKSDQIISDLELCIIGENKSCDPTVLKKFKSIFKVIKFDPNDTKSFFNLKQTLNNYETKHKTCFNRFFYLSVPPNVVQPIVKKLGIVNLNSKCSHDKANSFLLMEKPFGSDLDSAKALIKETARFFEEDQIYRIDHYLAKESAQNILTFRKNNPIFEDLWSNKYISKITISALEKLGIEQRVNFYEHTGALRDLIQSHLIQLLSLVTMKVPDNLDDSSLIHKHKLKLLKSVNEVSLFDIKNNLVAGQYKGYLQEVHNPNSKTETYIKIKLTINSKEWHNVPIYLETGKSLNVKQTEIKIYFISPNDTKQQNILSFRIQPNEGIDIVLNVKEPGLNPKIVPVNMDFSYKNNFIEPNHPDAYERVLIDAIRGDSSLFASSEDVLQSWRIIEPILKYWEKNDKNLKIYPKSAKLPIK